MKKALGTLRNHWQGLQIYLRGGVRLIRPIADADPSLSGSEAIRVLFQTYLTARRPNITITYIRDDTTDADEDPEQEGPAPSHSVAHPMLHYGAIVEDTFYEQLQAARDKHEPHLYNSYATQFREADFMEQMKTVAPMVFAAKSDPRNVGGMADNSDHMNLDDP